MGLGDLFKPKWKHSDPKIRSAAVEKLTDQSLLAEIARKDVHDDVRSAAVKNPNFTDQSLLAKFAKKGENRHWPSVQWAAVKKLTDQDLLAEIARNDVNCLTRRAAVENPNFTDQSLLAEIAKKDLYFDVRKYAVEKITDQDLLTEIARNDVHDYVRSAAVKNPNFTDQSLLAEIAKKDVDSGVREYAVEKLTDQSLLAEIARKDVHIYVRKNAIKKLSNQMYGSIKPWIDIEETKKLNDQTILVKISKFAGDNDVRKNAIKKLSDQMYSSIKPWIDIEETRKLNNQSLLAEIAKNSAVLELRSAAVKKLTNQAELAEIAKNGGSHERYHAVKNPNFTDQSLLVEIAMNDKGATVRQKAVEKFSPDNLEPFLLSCHPIKSLIAMSSWRTALEAYICLKITPPKQLIKILNEIIHTNRSDVQEDLRSSFDSLEETAKKALELFPEDINRILLKIKEGTLDEKTAALKKIMYVMKASDKEVIKLLAQKVSDKTLGFLQEDIIRYLGSLGAQAELSLDALRKIYKSASRPVTMDDFKEQQRLAGDASSLMSSIREKVIRGEPIAPGLMRVTEKAIESIEKAII